MPLQLLKAVPWVPGTPRKLILREAEEVKDQAAEARQPYQYAILSHRWGSLKDEILYADLERYCDPIIRQEEGYISVDLEQEPAASLKRKAGWFKIEAALDQAQRDGYSWLWADTCCINKGSSAELSEAINTMFEWYQGSAICYAFLEDVSSADEPDVRRRKFRNSLWFTRGWTLQELLAPLQVIFYSTQWIALGNKRSLAAPISEITKIDLETLHGRKSVQSASVAKRMSWAAGRRTKRIEDRAYSLMGLFGVYMPMLYGEGSKAFQRLQEEILKISDDQSIFCWIDSTVGGRRHGLLADSPDAFVHASEYRKYDGFGEQPAFDMSNRGLGISLHITPSEKPIFVAALLCPHPESLDGYLAIYVEQLPTGERQYARIRCDELGFIQVPGRLEQIFVKPSFPRLDDWSTVMPLHLFHLDRLKSGIDFQYRIANTFTIPFDRRDFEAHNLNLPAIGNNIPSTFKIIKDEGRVSVVFLLKRNTDDERFAILLGSSANFDVGFDLVQCTELLSMEEYEEQFNPTAFGKTLSLAYHHVTARAEIKVQAGVKVYMLSFMVQGVELPPPPTIIDDAVDAVIGKGKHADRLGRMKQSLWGGEPSTARPSKAEEATRLRRSQFEYSMSESSTKVEGK